MKRRYCAMSNALWARVQWGRWSAVMLGSPCTLSRQLRPQLRLDCPHCSHHLFHPAKRRTPRRERFPATARTAAKNEAMAVLVLEGLTTGATEAQRRIA